MRYQTHFRLTLVLAAALALGCGGDDVVEPPVATSAVVVPAAVNLVALQERAGFQATIHDQNGQVMPGAPVTWSTSDPSVVTVDATGTAVSVGNGRAQVAAASGNAMASASVAVAQRGAVVEVDWGGPRLLLGDSVQATLPVANDPNGHRVAPARITWTTSDPAIATVDTDGWVRTVGPGQVRIGIDVGGFVAARDYSVELDPGFLEVALTLPPNARDIGAHLSIHGPIDIPGIEGPAVDSVHAADYELYRSRATAPTQIIIAGPLSSGPVLEFWVPHRPLLAQYRVQLLQIAGEDYALRDLAGYSIHISP
ncbi:MAG: hypothetical protein F4X47_11170 [Gammaproteobacteria bacterium]|nr:hypothetical protein [Gammaproteobacteria bacterium]MYC52865.1 hypothetical protein [Gammaproteobacteria bacterium]